MRRIIAGMLLGLIMGCVAWAVGGQGSLPGPDRSDQVFTARYQAQVRLGETPAGAICLPMDTCGACLEVCRDLGDGYSDCAERCRRACNLGPASAWADAR